MPVTGVTAGLVRVPEPERTAGDLEARPRPAWRLPRNRVGPPGGPVHSFEGRYLDIVPDQRIAFAYDMHLDDTRRSVSLATVELRPARAGTRLIFTEQAAFLDGYNDLAGLEEGTRAGLDDLDAELRREPARA